MISKITLENFFSFRYSTTIELNAGVNILLGINGSGKSNFLKAIYFLKESVVGGGLEKTFLRDWGGFISVANFNMNEKDFIKMTFEFDSNVIKKMMQNKGFPFPGNPIYEIEIIRSGATSYFLKEKLYSKDLKKKEKNFIYMEMSNAQGVISTREGGKVGIQKYPQKSEQINFKSTELILGQISDPNRFYPLFTLKKAIEEISCYDYFDTSTGSITRRPSGYGIDSKLAHDGRDIAIILNKIKNSHSIEYEKIEQSIRKIHPYFKDISFDFIGSKIYLVLREEYLSKSVSIENISDGTLRYLILLSILFNPQRGSIVCIDEPEISLHPDMINTISEAIRQASVSSQLIVATHSPLLLNSFDIDDVLVFEKNSQNETCVSVKFSDEFDDYSTGQIWLQGKIGGKRW